MSDWKSVSGFITSAPLDLTFFGKSNRAMVRISPDGKVEYGPDYTPDAAAKAFWEAVNHHGPYAENTRLREENARLREAVKAAYYEGWQDNASIDDTEDRLHAEWEHSEARVAIRKTSK